MANSTLPVVSSTSPPAFHDEPSVVAEERPGRAAGWYVLVAGSKTKSRGTARATRSFVQKAAMRSCSERDEPDRAAFAVAVPTTSTEEMTSPTNAVLLWRLESNFI